MYNRDKESILKTEPNWLEDRQTYERLILEELKTESFTASICSPEIYDIQQLINLEYTCFPTDRLSRKEFAKAIKSDKSFFKIVIVEKVIVAYIICAILPVSKRLRIYSIGVHPSYRNYSIARTLIDRAEKYAIEIGMTELYLEVDCQNESAIQLYESVGFTSFSKYENYYENGNDAIRYKKPLEQL